MREDSSFSQSFCRTAVSGEKLFPERHIDPREEDEEYLCPGGTVPPLYRLCYLDSSSNVFMALIYTARPDMLGGIPFSPVLVCKGPHAFSSSRLLKASFSF